MKSRLFRNRPYFFHQRVCASLVAIFVSSLAWANPEYYVESPSTSTRESAEAHLSSIPSLGDGIEARVIRRFRVGEGWAYVVRVDYLELVQAQSVADSLGTEGSPGVIYRRIGSRTVRVLDTDEPVQPSEPSLNENSPTAEIDAAIDIVESLDTTPGQIEEALQEGTIPVLEEDFEPRLQSADSILARAVRAHGGPDGGLRQIEGAGSVLFNYARTVGIDNETIVVDHAYVRLGEGRRLRVDVMEGEGVDSLTVVDRSGDAWVSTDGSVVDRDPDRTVEVLADYGPSEILGVSMLVAANVSDPDQWSNLVLTGVEASPGGERAVLQMPEGTGRGLRALAFDSVRSLLVGATWNTMDGVVRMGFEDYRYTAEDLVYPGRVTVWLDDAIMERIVVTDLRLNQPVEARLFERPSGASPN